MSERELDIREIIKKFETSKKRRERRRRKKQEEEEKKEEIKKRKERGEDVDDLEKEQ